MSSIIPYVGRGAVVLARNPAAVAALKTVASKIWEHRHLIGETVVAAKDLFTSSVASRAPGKKGRRHVNLAYRSTIPSTISVTQPLQSGYIQRNSNFTRMSSSSDGQSCLVVGSQRANSVVRREGVSLNANNCLFGGLNAVPTGGAFLRRGQGILMNPVLLSVQDSGNPSIGRLGTFENLFAQFRIRHLHVRYVPRLNMVDTRHGTINLAYTTDPSTLADVATGSFGLASANLFSSTSPSVTGPSWAPLDLELNFPDPEWFMTNPEGITMETTADDLIANMRQSCQGLIMGTWVDSRDNFTDSTVVGYIYMDYAIEFRAPVWDQPDLVTMNLTSQERRDLATLIQDGWTPTELLRTANVTPTALLHNRADLGAGAPNLVKTKTNSAVRQN